MRTGEEIDGGRNEDSQVMREEGVEEAAGLLSGRPSGSSNDPIIMPTNDDGSIPSTNVVDFVAGPPPELYECIHEVSVTTK